MSHITVIGGSGFIGSRLICLLSKTGLHSYSIIDKVKPIDLSVEHSIADISIDSFLSSNIPPDSVIVNLAAVHHDNVSPLSLYSDTNIKGASNICDLARVQNINYIIFTSSVAVYGFSPTPTDETGLISPSNEYGRTKYEAELIYKSWQAELPNIRTLVIVRPTVVFGEGNRGNVFNLLNHIVSFRFFMIGSGRNRKSMAYVENIAAFLEHSIEFQPGVYVFNYADKPDYSMNDLVSYVNKLLGRSPDIKIRLPFFLCLLTAFFLDFFAKLFGKKFNISFVRVKKFCANSVYESAVESTGFTPPISLQEGLQRTIFFEFKQEKK